MKKNFLCVTIVSMFSLFFLCSSASADELLELKKQLRITQDEKLVQEKRIEKLEHKIMVLESEKQEDNQKIKEIEKQIVTDSVKQKKEKKSKVALKYYWDTREYNTFEIATSTNGLPLGFTFWGFTDLHGHQDRIDDFFDFDRFFMEYRLSRVIDPEWFFGVKGLGFQIEYNDSNGSGNQLTRFGLTYKQLIPWFTKKDAWVQFRGFPYESDGSGQQLSWIYYVPLHEKFWITGFADLNLREGTDDRWIIEPQLNIKLNDRTNFIIEYRYNGFEDASATAKGEGVAIGVDIKF